MSKNNKSWRPKLGTILTKNEKENSWTRVMDIEPGEKFECLAYRDVPLGAIDVRRIKNRQTYIMRISNFINDSCIWK